MRPASGGRAGLQNFVRLLNFANRLSAACFPPGFPAGAPGLGNRLAMVFYLSATGNSHWAALQIARHFGGALYSMADEMRKTAGKLSYEVGPGERVFFVFPVHAWGPALLAGRFVSRLELAGYRDQEVFSVCTCGDTCGNTDHLMARRLAKAGLRQRACFSVAMPNTYILMKGFGLDSPELAREKLSRAPGRVSEIVRRIEAGGNAEGLYQRGSKPFLKSGIVHPLFGRFAVKRCQFHADGNCISCGLCAQVCPTGNIRMEAGKPVWGKDCVQCTACIHHCPEKALQFADLTQTQDRYLHPGERAGWQEE